MIIIYTQELKTAMFFGACLGGISHRGKIVKDLSDKAIEAEVKEDAESLCYIRTSIGSDPAVIVWGEGYVEPYRMNEYGGNINFDEGFGVPEVKFKVKEEYKKQVDTICSIFNNDSHEVIYDASTGGDRHIAFTCLYSYAECKKDIRRVELKSMHKQDIAEAFKSPLSVAETYKFKQRDRAHIYTYYLANSNLPLALSKALNPPFPKAKEMPVLAYIVERNDEIEKEIAKNYYMVSLQITTGGGEKIILRSRNAKFPTKEAAQEFASKIPASTGISLEERLDIELPKGPHSGESIEKEAETTYKYSRIKTQLILSQLYSDGFITTDNTKSRKFPHDSQDRVNEMYAALEKTKAFRDLLSKVEDRSVPEEFFSEDNKSGILITRKSSNDPSFHDMERRNIYYLICKEIIKPCLGQRTVLRRKASIRYDNINFSYIGLELKNPGFSVLDEYKPLKNDIPASLKDGDIVKVHYMIESKLSSLPAQRKEEDVIKAFTENSKLGIKFMPDEIRNAIDGLVSRQLIIRKGSYLLPTEHGSEVLHFAEHVDGMIFSVNTWEETLKNIVDPDTNTDQAEQLAVSLGVTVQQTVKKWHKEVNEIAGKRVDIMCPSCGRSLYSNSTGLTCKECGYFASRNQNGRNMSDEEFAYLIIHRSTPFLSGFTIEDGDTLGRLYLDEKNNIIFTKDSPDDCPSCRKKLRIKDGTHYCPSCGFKLEHTVLDHELTAEEITQLISQLRTKRITGLRDDKGEAFSGVIYLDVDDKLKVKAIRIDGKAV